MKKLITLSLALLLALSACSALAETQLPITEETVKFTAMLRLENDAMTPIDEQAYIKSIEERTNVDFEWTTVPAAALAEKVANVFATQELPDLIVRCLSNSDVLSYGMAGALLPFDEYLDVMPNLKRILEENPSVAAVSTQPDGHIYGLPQVNMWSYWPGDGAYARTSVWINQKWLEAVSMDMPTTTEEFYNVLKAFKEKDPNGNGIADEIPFSFCYTTWGENSAAFLYGPFGIIGQGDNLNVEDGKVFYAIQDERYVEAIKFANRLYDAGLVDTEAYTQNSGRYYAKGQDETELYGCFICWDGVTTVGSTRASVTGNADYVPLPPLAGPDGTRLWSNQSAGVNANYLSVASTCEDPETMCKFLDFLYEPDESIQVIWGAFGVGTDKNPENDGWYQYVPENPEAHGYATSTLWILASTPRNLNAFVDDDMVRKMSVKNVDTGAVTTKADVDKYQISLVYAPYCVEEYYPSVVLSAEENETISIISTPVINAIKEREIAWIIGAADIEKEWADFNEDLKKMGIDTMTTIYQTALDRVSNK